MDLARSLCVLTPLLLGACIVEAPGGASPNARRQAVVTTVPPLALRSGADLGGLVELVGASVQPARLVPGEPARLTLYFRALASVEQEHLVFVHVEDAEAGGTRLNFDHPPTGGVYPITQWKRGETVRDEFTLTLPATTTARSVNVWVGLWQPETDARLPLRNPQAVRNDGASRVLLAQLPVAQG